MRNHEKLNHEKPCETMRSGGARNHEGAIRSDLEARFIFPVMIQNKHNKQTYGGNIWNNAARLSFSATP